MSVRRSGLMRLRLRVEDTGAVVTLLSKRGGNVLSCTSTMKPGYGGAAMRSETQLDSTEVLEAFRFCNEGWPGLGDSIREVNLARLVCV